MSATRIDPPIVEVNRADYTGTPDPADGQGPDTQSRGTDGKRAPAQDHPRDGNGKPANPDGRQAGPDGKPAGPDGKPAGPDGKPAEAGDHQNQHSDENEIPKDLPRPKAGAIILAAVLFAAALIGIFILGWVPHHSEAEETNSDAKEANSGTPSVTVDHPHTQVMSKDVVLPCDVRANQQTAIFGRANGYLKQWSVDIGGHVKQGQVIAVIETPDVDAQLLEAKATVESAKANVVKSRADVDVAKTDYDRYLKAQKDNPGSVTQQDVDTKKAAYADAAGALEVANATVAQNQAEVGRLTVLQGFEQVVAPFSGTITARNYDVGALINPSNTAAGTEMFDVADTDTLRVFVNVPQTYSTDIKMGQPAFLTVRNYPQREFKGIVARMAGALDQNTRTLPFEVDFSNSDGSLYAGMYGQARLPVAQSEQVLMIPTSSLIFDKEGLQVALVKDGKIHFQKISVGRDMGTQIEVNTGVTSDDEVVTNPGEKLAEGVEVNAKTADAAPAGK